MFSVQGPLSKWIIDGKKAVSNAKDIPDVFNTTNKRLKELFIEVDPEIKRLKKLQKEIADEINILKNLKKDNDPEEIHNDLVEELKEAKSKARLISFFSKRDPDNKYAAEQAEIAVNKVNVLEKSLQNSKESLTYLNKDI